MNIFYKIKHAFETKSLYWASNFPKAWSLGWLTQLCITAIMFLLTFIIALIIPVSAIDTPDVISWYALGYIPATFWTLFIVYRLVKYNSEKLYGNRTIWHNFIELPSYIIQFALPLLIPVIIGTTLTFRIASLIEDDKLDANANAFEEAQPFFTFDYGSSNYMYFDGNYNMTASYNYDYLHEMFKYFENDERYYKYIISDYNREEEEELVYEMMNGQYGQKSLDSLSNYRWQMKDSIAFHKGIFKNKRPKLYPYRFYEFYTDNYGYSYNYEYDNDYLINQDSLKQLYFYKYFKNEQFIAEKYNKLLLSMKSIGIENIPFNSTQLLNLYNNNVYFPYNKDLRFRVQQFDRQISLYKKQLNYIKTCKNKNFFFIYDTEIYQILFSLVFGLCLLLALFKNMNWKEFLVGLLFVCLLPTLLGIFMAIMRWQEEAVTFTFWSIFIILIVWGIIEKRKTIRRKRGAILLMIPHLLMAYFPIAVLGTLSGIFNFWDWDYFDRYLVHTPTVYNPNNMSYSEEYWDLRNQSRDWALIGGYVAYLFVLYPLWIKRDWLNFISKPKKS